MEPIADARALITERFPDARAALLGGGILSARRTETSDVARRRPTLARMCADGVLLCDIDGTGVLVAEQARAGSTDPGETAVICWSVFGEIAELDLLLDGRWLRTGKWLLRELRTADPVLADDLLDAREARTG